MPTEGVEKVIERAITDEAFRTLLFDEPDKALAGSGLTEQEIASLKGLKPEQFEAATGDLEQRVSKIAAPLLPGGAVLGSP